MDGLVLLPVLLQEQQDSIDGICHPAPLDKATLVQCDADHFAESGVKDPLEDLHRMAQEANWSVI